MTFFDVTNEMEKKRNITRVFCKHEQERHNVEELASYSEARCNITRLIQERL